MIGAVEIEGHAIISADGMIAEADGAMPKSLMNEADWRLFQADLDAAALVVLGRIGHFRHPNPGRRRLVLTSAVNGLAADRQDLSSVFWNPATLSFNHVLGELGIGRGTVAVTGGTAVFDHFLGIGYDRFVLSTARRVRIPEGRPCFASGMPEAILAAHGFVAGPCEVIDAAAEVTRTVWSCA
jgi:hypothetical protein